MTDDPQKKLPGQSEDQRSSGGCWEFYKKVEKVEMIPV